MSEPTASNDVQQQQPPPQPKKRSAPKPQGAHVYHAINQVKIELDAGGGITKDRQVEYGERYRFRGIDDMYNTLCALTAESGLVMIPRVIDRQVEREERKGGGLQTHVWLHVEVDFISTVDGSKHTGSFVGEAIDTSDKASNKAMSAAMKYACIMVFQIPTHGESKEDIEVDNHEVGQPQYNAPTKGRGIPKLDTSDDAVARQIALADRVKKAQSFAELYALQQETDKIPEPGRGAVMLRIHDATQDLLQQVPDVKTLKESRGLIEALGTPPTLMGMYTKMYNGFRKAVQ